MCSRVNCRKCGKVTYSGCGQHLDQVFAGVPKDKRCDCGSKPAATSDKPSLLGKIFGR